MRNKFSGKCFKCGEEVKAGKGFFQVNRKHFIKDKGRWLLRCQRCVGGGN